MEKEKKAIVVVSFGVSDENQQRRCIDALVADIMQEFPDYEVRLAFTSAMIRRRLEQEGRHMPSLEEVLAEMAEAGFTKVAIQPTHLTPGEEFDNKIRAIVEGDSFPTLQIGVGRPVFTWQGEEGKPDDYADGLDFLLECFILVEDEELVLMGHGSPHRHNPVYERLQAIADRENKHMHVGVIEDSDTPNLETVKERLKKTGTDKIFLAPLMFVGGVHVMEDMAGNEPESWKSILRAEGYEVNVLPHGLGSLPKFRRIYVEHLKDAIKEM